MARGADSTLGQVAALARRRPWEIAAILFAAAGIGIWIYSGVHSALGQLASQSLHTLLNSETLALETWIGEKRLNVQRWAADSRVALPAQQLLLASARGEAALSNACQGPRAAELIAAIDHLRQQDAAAAVHLIDREGRIIAARDRAMCGLRLSDAQRAAFAPVLAGVTRFAATMTERERVGAGDRQREPKVWIATPVLDGQGQPVAVLDIGKPAGEGFSKLFEAARFGSTGESYAFDGQGRLLSESRFRAELEDSGRLRAGQSSILALRLTEPDGASAEAPPSKLLRQAFAARQQGDDSGELRTPYTSYLGHDVVGAWRWLPEYGFGVAVEVSEREAFAPIDRLESAFIVLGVLVGTAVFSLVVILLRMQVMAQQVAAARQVGNYELFEEIGEGGIARVYRAQHRLLKRPTAVKVIQLHQATDELLARFDREVRLCSQLMHPNTIEIFDFGRTPEGLPFYAMELLDGSTLQQLVERGGPFSVARTVHALRAVAGSLAEAHGRGLVHRDVKPANIMLCRKGGEFDVVKLLDFGLIKDTRGEHTRDLTHALKILGTPSYMAPERIERPDGADLRSDLYAIGAVGYFLLSGRAPVDGSTDLSLAYHVVHTAPAPIESVAAQPLPPSLAQLITQCLAKRADERPQSARAIGEMLDRIAVEHGWTQAAARAAWEAHRPRAGEAPAPASIDVAA